MVIVRQNIFSFGRQMRKGSSNSVPNHIETIIAPFDCQKIFPIDSQKTTDLPENTEECYHHIKKKLGVYTEARLKPLF